MPPEQNKIPEGVVVPPQEKLVQTYASDMAQAIGDDRGGMIKKIIHEEEAKQKEHGNPELIKNRIFSGAGILLLALALITVGYFMTNKNEVGTVSVTTSMPMIFTDKSTTLEVGDLTKESFAEALWVEAAAVDVKYGGIEQVNLTSNKRALGLRGLIALLKSTVFLSSPQLVDDNFLLGIYVWETRSPFILIKMRSIPDIFSSMRAWEGKMFLELHGIFGAEINADTNYLTVKSFEDGIVENKNARILYGTNGEVALVYVFLDDSHMIIASDLVAVHEVALRLAGSRIKQ